jgi:phage tail-like protein
LGAETDVVEHKTLAKTDGGVESIIEMIPGRTKWDRLKLKRGITDNRDFWEWMEYVKSGKVREARRNGTVYMLDQEGNEVASWKFSNGWPAKVSGPELKADSNTYGVEELTIVHEGIWREK